MNFLKKKLCREKLSKSIQIRYIQMSLQKAISVFVIFVSNVQFAVSVASKIEFVKIISLRFNPCWLNSFIFTKNEMHWQATVAEYCRQFIWPSDVKNSRRKRKLANKHIVMKKITLFNLFGIIKKYEELNEEKDCRTNTNYPANYARCN